MVDNLNRKLTLIIGAFAVAVIALLLLPFRLGLDLEGGTRLRYSVDLEKARAEQLIPAGQTDSAALEDIMKVWRKRVDPQGISGVKMRREGSNAIVIELPGSADIVAKKADGVLAGPLETLDNENRLMLKPTDGAGDFPSSGGRVEVGDAILSYSRIVTITQRSPGDEKAVVVSGYSMRGVELLEGAAMPVIAENTPIKLEASDPWRALIENTGRMVVLMVAEEGNLAADGDRISDLSTELDKAKAWMAENPNVEISEYNDKLAAENVDSPVGRLRFFPSAEREGNAGASTVDRLRALIVQTNPDWQFSGSDFTRIFGAYDDKGLPAVGFDIATNRHNDFEAFTTEYTKKEMAIVVDGEIVTAPSLNDPLRRGGQITGGRFGFKQEEVNELVKAINSGSLNVEPRFEDRETVGASLGEEYVRTGFMSVIFGLIAVLAFVVIYYKRLGTYAAISLVFNLVLLMGAMAMLQATLTLPGVAGIILTVGMAVDANILIYERIREEALRGRRPAQSAKDGFANALSTIVDANLTTLITAIILYNFGSGPVQGFATTLIVGILTSMFAALVFTRVMVHFAVEKGVDEWRMMRLVNDTNIRFMATAKKTVFLSIGLIVVGVGFFASLERVDKYSIDFLGGNSMQIVTAKAEKQDTISKKLAELGGVFADAQVQPLLSSAEDEGYRKFQVEFKAENTEDSDASKRYRQQVVDGLKDILAPNRFTFENSGEGGAAGKIYFEDTHPLADVKGILDGAGLGGDVELTPIDGTDAAANTFGFKAISTDSQNAVEARMGDAFSYKKDSAGRDFTLAQPVPESSAVGPQVVQKLRDDAILAIILSLFAVVMYIRVRFTEYSYGFAAVIALVHDVLVTLGFLALAIKLNIINAQISLVMIAAFLTIIGYSLNDTIVVFDRIRENLKPLAGKMKLADIIDRSINQTLARTVLTSVTTMITVLILFAFNFGSRNDLEGFAYAVIVGVVVGTYSSMFVASPALLWFESRRQANRSDEDDTESTQSAKAEVATT